MIGTLIRLFRGRKFNTIRGREDSISFNVSEMYLGVMVISIALFLLPTLAIFYYYAFISIMLSVIVL
jgi:phosphatidylinositol glycan class Q protein